VSVETINTDLLHGYSISESIPYHTEYKQFKAFIGKLEKRGFVLIFQEKYKTKGVNLAKIGATGL